MDITLQTKVADLLNSYPELEAKLLELSPIFSKLKNPVLRRTVAKVTSLQQAAGVAGISPAMLVQELRKAAGLTSIDMNVADNNLLETAEPPCWFNENKIKIKFDASPLIENGESPMKEIIKLSSQVSRGEILQLIAPFKPLPIIDILRSKGFNVWINENSSYFIKE